MDNRDLMDGFEVSASREAKEMAKHIIKAYLPRSYEILHSKLLRQWAIYIGLERSSCRIPLTDEHFADTPAGEGRWGL